MKNFITKLNWKIKELLNIPKATYLCWKYPFIKGWCNRDKFFQTWSYYDSIPKGWRKAFGIQLLKEMKHVALKYAGKKAYKEMHVDYIKEKWGILDINGSFPNEVWKVIHKYEYISMHTCIECGELATVRSTGWICPYCDEHIGDKYCLHFGHSKGTKWYGWSGNMDGIPDEEWEEEEKLLKDRYGTNNSTSSKEDNN